MELIKLASKKKLAIQYVVLHYTFIIMNSAFVILIMYHENIKLHSHMLCESVHNHETEQIPN